MQTVKRFVAECFRKDSKTFNSGFATFFRNKFPGLFQDSDWFFKGSKIHINHYTPKISVLILITAVHTLHIFWLSLTDFQNFPGLVPFFQDSPVLENARIKFQDFPDFPGPIRTLFITSQKKIWFSKIMLCVNANEETFKEAMFWQHHLLVYTGA